jgi:hypothetical protein
MRRLRAGWLDPHQQAKAHNRNDDLHFSDPQFESAVVLNSGAPLTFIAV